MIDRPRQTGAVELARRLQSADTRLSGLSLEGPIHRSPNGDVYRGRCDRLPYPLAVKKCNNSASTRLNFEALSRLASDPPAEAAFTVPSPVGIYCDDTVVVMQWIAAPSFRTQILDLRTPNSLIEINARRSAEWLKWLHSVDAKEPAIVDVEPKMHRGLVYLSRDDFVISDPVVAKAKELLFSTSHELARYPAPTVLIHGDFKPENILISNRSVFGIDIARQHQSCGDEDVVHFTNSMSMLVIFPAGLRHYKNMSGFVRKFLIGYYGSEEDLVRYHWLRLQHFLRIWEHYAMRKGRRLTNRYHIFWVRRFLQIAGDDLTACLSAQ